MNWNQKALAVDDNGVWDIFIKIILIMLPEFVLAMWLYTWDFILEI